ncbi:MAG: KpsF/GutQ family sugar-phosphate isomerase [Rhabdochlamydiaceae bacterium]
MWQHLLNEQKKNLDYFYENLDLSQLHAVFEDCLACKGLIIFTGVGKSGIIAEKIAMTLSSTGSRAIFLPSTNFLHGDIGLLSDQDILFLFSKSGETEELLSLIPYIKNKKTSLVAVVCRKNSSLGKECNKEMILPMMRELCPFDLAPTTSTAVQLLFGDLLAIALMKQKQFNLFDYAQTHPSGTLGKKITMTVDDLMLKNADLPFCFTSTSLKDSLAILTVKGCGCVLVLDDDQKLIGLFTDGDLRRALQNKGPSILELPIKEVMTNKYVSIETGRLAWEGLQLMQKDPGKWISVLPVIDQRGHAVGLLRMHDIIHAGLI